MPPSHDERSSEELARGAQEGSRECFAELVRRHERGLYAFLRLRARSAEDAEDLAQEAFVRAWTKLASYRDEWRFSTWLFTLARNVAASRGRREAAPTRGEDELALVAVELDPSVELAAREESSRIWQLAERLLGLDQRSALWLRYVEELGIDEIARVLGRSRVGVRVMLFRARATLARGLELPATGPRRAPADRRASPLRATEPPPAARLPGGAP